jgi:hypothetical protein
MTQFSLKETQQLLFLLFLYLTCILFSASASLTFLRAGMNGYHKELVDRKAGDRGFAKNVYGALATYVSLQRYMLLFAWSVTTSTTVWSGVWSGRIGWAFNIGSTVLSICMWILLNRFEDVIEAHEIRLYSDEQQVPVTTEGTE